MSITIEEIGLAVQGSQAPAVLLSLAIEKGLDIDKIEKMLVLQEKWDATQARKAYYVAMAAFKAEPLEIEKDRHVKFQTTKGVTEYDHATLGNVINQINGGLSKYGLSAAWELAQDKTQVTVTCRISHALGHSESTSLTAGLDDTGGKNVIQQLGSTISYLERYTVMALTGTASKFQDDDGKVTDKVIELITDVQKAFIVDLLKTKGITEGRWVKYLEKFNIESIDTIQSKEYDKVLAGINATEGKK
jgi:hypothetical protein